MEQMSGSDALLWNMEQPDNPIHTLKILVLDPGRRGRPISIDEVAAAVGPRLGIVKRATQKVVAARGFPGIPFWVDDPDFESGSTSMSGRCPSLRQRGTSTPSTPNWPCRRSPEIARCGR